MLPILSHEKRKIKPFSNRIFSFFKTPFLPSPTPHQTHHTSPLTLEGLMVSNTQNWPLKQIKRGVCQCSWNMSHAASSSLCTWITVVSFSGFSQTLPTGCQFRVLPDQRAGC